MRERIYGRNPVYECLRANKRAFYQLFIRKNIRVTEKIEEILKLCQDRSLPIHNVDSSRLQSIDPRTQGVALEVSLFPYVTIHDIIDNVESSRKPALLLILDSLKDPQNMGTLLRTCDAVGVHGVIIPYRRTALITPAVVKSSSGACEHILVGQMNLSQAISMLKDKGLWIIGLEGKSEGVELSQISLTQPLAFVVGSESSGIRQNIKSSCDHLLQLPMLGNVDSLNAAVAGSIVLYSTLFARETENH